MAEILRHPEIQGPLETFADKGVKDIFGQGMMIIGIIMWESAFVGLGLISYFAGDKIAKFASRIRRGNAPAIGNPATAHGH